MFSRRSHSSFSPQSGFSLFLLSVFSLLSFSWGLQIWPNSSSLPDTIPQTCREALSANITCSPSLISAQSIALQSQLSNNLLTEYCTSSCQNSLLSYQANILQNCGNETYAFSDTTNQTGSAIADPLVWAYNVACTTDSDQTTFCLPGLFNRTYSACSNCLLRYEANLLGSNYGRAIVNPDSFSSQLSSCSVPATSYPYSTPASTPTATSNSTAPTATPYCSGDTYTVQSGDTCVSIGQANSVATDRLISQNNLDYNCTTLQPGDELCLGSTCQLQTVQQNQTCDDILADQPYYLSQLIAWNPTIHNSCDNLGIMVGRGICISPPGTASWETPSNSTDVTTTPVSFVVPTGTFAPAPNATTTQNFTTSWYVPTVLPPVPTSNSTMNQSTVDALNERTEWCPITSDDASRGFVFADLPEDCQEAVDPYCNPAPTDPVLSSTTFAASCYPTYYYNMTNTATPTSTTAGNTAPTQTGITSNCNTFYNVSSTDSCQTIVDKYPNITLADFYCWNPAVGSTCKYLYPGYDVCVGVSSPVASCSATSTSVSPSGTGSAGSTPSPLMPDTWTNCSKYYQIKDGDGCWDVEQNNTISKDQFNTWNPYVGSNCQNFWPGYYLCVSPPSSSSSTAQSTTPTSTTPTATSSPSSTVPSPLMPSTRADCPQYYQIQDGDGCWNVEQKYDISTDQFNAWNPYVGSQCQNFWPGYYLCVATPSGGSSSAPSTTTASPTTTSGSSSSTVPSPLMPSTLTDCSKYYQIQNGDGCWDVEQNNGISADQFNSWNPYVGSNCQNFWPGYYLCVGAPSGASSTTKPTTTTTQSASSTSPSPIMPSSKTDCSKYYKIQSGDGCWDIEHDNNITADQFNAWNPDVGSDCSNLWPGYYVCVAS
ncbi:carbohydrate-binding module family 50 protein [Xylona heveae TC161]|uniref:Carbohydrate-binding module family 50 protein n=1 Tax=Xylona heveae (strain CBS 132557 / TC161) TaxID=1328760 RepID=A0A165AI98_XYLHT|nr:carbohydrate-binding module family 50 protein [Xylona heveae TC161]KZF20520.1 carbohydrate-binding module family 50 protein [Xylona heveae TC161]